MRMTRHFFISSDLDDLERLERDLENAGIVTPQIHALTLDEGGADQHRDLHQVVSLMKRDIIHSTLLGAIIGLCAAILILISAYAAGWTESAAGWVPFVFLAIVILGFFTWEGGLLGIGEPNARFRRFRDALENGKHVFFVDLEPGQDDILYRVASYHDSLEPAGTGPGSPRWLVFLQHRVKRFFVETFP